MEFLVTRFLRALTRDYGFNYIETMHTDKCIAITVTGIPSALRYKLVKTNITIDSGIADIDMSGYVIRGPVGVKDIPLCESIPLDIGGTGVKIVFDSDHYAKKLNMLDFLIRRYYGTHSMIDKINHIK